MSIKQLKFIEQDFASSDIVSLPDRPNEAGISAQAFKERFDKIGKYMLALGNFNALVDALTGIDGSSEITTEPHSDITADNIGDFMRQLADKRVIFSTGDAKYLRVGTNGEIQLSPDGQSWTSYKSAYQNALDGGFAGTEQQFNAALGRIADKSETQTFQAVIPAASWQGPPYEQTVAVAGMLQTDNPVIDVVLSDTLATAKSQLEAFGEVSRIVAQNGAIKVFAYRDKPAVDLPIQLKVVR